MTGILSDQRFRRLTAARTISVLGNAFVCVALAFAGASPPRGCVS